MFIQVAFSLDFYHPAFDPERVSFPENRFIFEKANAEEIDVAFLRWPDLPGAFQGQANLGQKFLDLFSRGMQFLFVRSQQYEIVDVADIILNPESFFDEMISWMITPRNPFMHTARNISEMVFRTAARCNH